MPERRQRRAEKLLVAIGLTETLQEFIGAWDDDGERELEPISIENALAESIERRRETYADDHPYRNRRRTRHGNGYRPNL